MTTSTVAHRRNHSNRPSTRQVVRANSPVPQRKALRLQGSRLTSHLPLVTALGVAIAGIALSF